MTGINYCCERILSALLSKTPHLDLSWVSEHPITTYVWMGLFALSNIELCE